MQIMRGYRRQNPVSNSVMSSKNAEGPLKMGVDFSERGEGEGDWKITLFSGDQSFNSKLFQAVSEKYCGFQIPSDK